MIKKYLLLLLLLSLLLHAGSINIAVAANVSYAFEALKREFAKTNPQTKVLVTLGSSGKLTAQIKNGAPYGLFMSANMKYPQALYAEGIATTKPRVYAQGALAYLSIRASDFSQGITLLKAPEIQKIAIANPATAPYGKAAFDAISAAGIYDDIKAKFVYAESISQAVTYALTAADIGFVAKSSLYSVQMSAYRENVHWHSVDPTLYTPIKQGIVLLKNADSPEYKAFYDFIFSDAAKSIFKQYGYMLP
jgi:molybdate transport system substrate-binding protein